MFLSPCVRFFYYVWLLPCKSVLKTLDSPTRPHTCYGLGRPPQLPARNARLIARVVNLISAPTYTPMGRKGRGPESQYV